MRLLLFVIAASLPIIKTVAQDERKDGPWLVKDNYYVKFNNIYQTRSGDKTLEECKEMCLKEIPGCASFDWIKDKQKCDFNSKHHLDAEDELIGPPRGRVSTHYSLGKPDNVCSCKVRGDPMVRTFDGGFAMTTQEGGFTYQMVNLKNPANPNCNFEIEMTTEQAVRGDRKIKFLSQPRSITFEMCGTRVYLGYQGFVKFGEEQIDASKGFKRDCFEVSKVKSKDNEAEFVRVANKECGVTVQYYGKGLDSVADIIVELDDERKEQKVGELLTGLCGNCDKNYRNDIKTKNGADLSNDTSRLTDQSKSFIIKETPEELNPGTEPEGPAQLPALKKLPKPTLF